MVIGVSDRKLRLEGTLYSRRAPWNLLANRRCHVMQKYVQIEQFFYLFIFFALLKVCDKLISNVQFCLKNIWYLGKKVVVFRRSFTFLLTRNSPLKVLI